VANAPPTAAVGTRISSGHPEQTWVSSLGAELLTDHYHWSVTILSLSHSNHCSAAYVLRACVATPAFKIVYSSSHFVMQCVLAGPCRASVVSGLISDGQYNLVTCIQCVVSPPLDMFRPKRVDTSVSLIVDAGKQRAFESCRTNVFLSSIVCFSVGVDTWCDV